MAAAIRMHLADDHIVPDMELKTAQEILSGIRENSPDPKTTS
jgi:hypothetical protein